LTIAVSWFPDKSLDTAFPKNSDKLWGVSAGWRTANSYDAILTIVNALKQHPQRQGLNKVLHQSDFNYTGVTGNIQFSSDGKRNDLPSSAAIIQVVSDVKSPFGFAFRRIQ
jgi:ABC-type branched-subunit amino acid transport system substrate-binding protein